MIISLFVNAVMTMLSALNQSHMQRLILWQMGSFSGRRISHAAVIFGCVTADAILIMFFHRELDILSYIMRDEDVTEIMVNGPDSIDEEAAAVGVDQKKTKVILLIISEGRLLAFGEKDAVLTEELLEKAYQFDVMAYLRKISACYH